MKEDRYYSAQLHIHSCYESSASMEGHMFEARKAGIDILWFTDHDYRMGIREDEITGFDFENGSLFVEEKFTDEEIKDYVMKFLGYINASGVCLNEGQYEKMRRLLERNARRYFGWEKQKSENPAESTVALSKEKACRGTQCLKIEAVSNQKDDRWQSIALKFVSSGKRHQYPLLSMVTLKIASFIEGNMAKDADARIVFEIKMSQHPPRHQAVRMKYVIGEMDGLSDDDSVVIPINMQTGQWHEHTFHISEDAEKYCAGGLDNVFDTIAIILEVRNGKKITCFFDDFQIIRRFAGEEVRTRQKELAESLSRKYGVISFIATEISKAGPHMNCFSTHIPIINYHDRGFNVSRKEAIGHVMDHGGIFSLNHPFEPLKNIISLFDEKEKEEFIEQMVRYYTLADCEGADLIEIGFPEGKQGFAFEDYLKLWDGLSRNGIFITGYGGSDSHSNDKLSGNNFVAWIAADEPVEEKLLNGMKCGNVYTGDPFAFKGSLSFRTSEGYRMGSVIRATKSEYELVFEADSVGPDWTVVWVVDGIRRKRVKPEGSAYHGNITLKPSGGVTFARVEIYNEANRCIVLTNPIYFILRDHVKVPPERRV